MELALTILAAFVAVTATGGGVALAAGLEGDRMPLEWLRRTPFESYVAPGLILAGAVGGSAAAALVALLVEPKLGYALSILAGAVLAGYVGVEIRILAQPSAPTRTEVFYLLVAGLMIALGAIVLATD